MALIDTHCHLDFSEDEKGWTQRAKEAGVGRIINVGTSIEGSRKSVEIAEKYSFGTNREKRFWTSQNDMIGSRTEFGMTKGGDFEVSASVGIHPQDGKKDVDKYGSLEKCIDELRKIARSSKKVVAVGEIGLDYHLAGGQRPVTSDQEKKFQRELFGEQIKLAVELDLPILIHCRSAWDAVFDFLSNVNGQLSNVSGLFHSWTGDWEAAKKALDLGFYISFSGIVTFKNAPLVQEVAKKTPLDRMLVETDSPFLSPEPHRGMKNEPKNVIITARFLAQLRGVSLATIEEATSDNAGRLLGI